jgi:hypothetical protein
MASAGYMSCWKLTDGLCHRLKKPGGGDHWNTSESNKTTSSPTKKDGIARPAVLLHCGQHSYRNADHPHNNDGQYPKLECHRKLSGNLSTDGPAAIDRLTQVTTYQAPHPVNVLDIKGFI